MANRKECVVDGKPAYELARPAFRRERARLARFSVHKHFHTDWAVFTLIGGHRIVGGASQRQRCLARAKRTHRRRYKRACAAAWLAIRFWLVCLTCAPPLSAPGRASSAVQDSRDWSDCCEELGGQRAESLSAITREVAVENYGGSRAVAQRWSGWRQQRPLIAAANQRAFVAIKNEHWWASFSLWFGHDSPPRITRGAAAPQNIPKSLVSGDADQQQPALNHSTTNMRVKSLKIHLMLTQLTL